MNNIQNEINKMKKLNHPNALMHDAFKQMTKLIEVFFKYIQTTFASCPVKKPIKPLKHHLKKQMKKESSKTSKKPPKVKHQRVPLTGSKFSKVKLPKGWGLVDGVMF